MGLLATGAGASRGLQTLIENMLAEEEARRRQEDTRSVIKDREVGQQHSARRLEQGDRSLGYQGRTQDRLDNSADISNSREQIRLDVLKRITEGDPSSPSPEGPPTGGFTPATGGSSAVRPTQGGFIENSNNPRGRAMLEIADLSPTAIHGSVPQAPRPEQYSPEETFYQGEAKKLGLNDYRELPPDRLLALSREWQKGRQVLTPFQSFEPVMLMDDPDNPGDTVGVPRSEAPGMRGPVPASQREKMDAYNATLDLVEEIEKLGDEINWEGIGPIEGRLGRVGMSVLGVGNPKAEALRNKLDEMKARASFQEGGKQFTGTERDMLNAFLTSVNSNPVAAKTRLKSFRESATRSLGSIGGKRINRNANPGDTAPDLYDQYLKRTAGVKPGSGGG